MSSFVLEVGVGAAIVLTTIYTSVVEWFFHRVVHHVWFAREHAHHHGDHHGPRFQTPGAFRRRQRLWVETTVVALHLPAFYAVGRSVSLAAAIASLLTMSIYAVLSDLFHVTAHSPGGGWYEHTRFFRAAVERHRGHHRDPTIHFCMLLPIGDWIFGTFARRRAQEGSR